MKLRPTQKILKLFTQQGKAGFILLVLLLSGVYAYAQPSIVFLQNGPSRIYSATLNFSTVDTLIKTGLTNPDGACFPMVPEKCFGWKVVEKGH